MFAILNLKVLPDNSSLIHLVYAHYHDCVEQVSGEITYNGHTFNEFVPQRTSAYVNQYDEVSGHAIAILCQDLGANIFAKEFFGHNGERLACSFILHYWLLLHTSEM